MINLAAVAAVEVVEAGQRAVGRGVPVVATAHARAGQRPFVSRVVSGNRNRATLRIDSVRPVNFRVSARQQEFAGFPIQRIVVTVPVRLDQRPSSRALDLHIYKYRIGNRVPIMHVMRRELKVPLELAARGIQGDHAVAVEVVSGSRCAVEVGSGIARAPVDQVEFRIVASRDPG